MRAMIYRLCCQCYRRLLAAANTVTTNDAVIGGGVGGKSLLLVEHGLRHHHHHQRSSSSSSSNQLSVLFYGSDDFSLPTLRLLADNYQLAAAVDDDDGGDGGSGQQQQQRQVIRQLDVVLSSPKNIIARYAHDRQLTCHEFPYDLPPTDGVYDIGVVASFGHLIPGRAIRSCRLGMLNIHGSLLPRWRGAAPVNYAVLNGDQRTGVTIMRIAPKRFDIGDIVAQAGYPVPPRITARQLKAELAPIGAQLLWECLLDIDNKLLNSRPQSSSGITYAPKFDDSYGLIDWSTMTATEVDRRFRAFIDFIDIYSHWTDGSRLRLYDLVDPELVATFDLKRLSGYDDTGRPGPGCIYYHKKRRLLCVSSAQNTWSAFGSVAVKGHKRMSAHQFNNGFIKRLETSVPIMLRSDMSSSSSSL
ncbi:methionyl-tRNA formyltransferase, mitochondrial-like [Oppia nitens]|uniref:methionyl-tRNA formyltransferase, mitochondrial-like n=1 Tax=Oppia nitens TaxID=1686743 RepID=UPI0023D9EF9C|nr:methionyl-tRNA formyltransferase, mitochondrial-like [Oppia nitens]